MRTVLSVLTLLGTLAALTALCYFIVPALFAHGSSAAFNAACLLSVVTAAGWIGAYYLVFGGRK